MTLTVALGIYFICWWIVWFAVLPFGITTHSDEGEPRADAPPGVPVRPNLRLKFVITTLIAGVLFAAIYAVIAYRLAPLDSIPFLKT